MSLVISIYVSRVSKPVPVQYFHSNRNQGSFFQLGRKYRTSLKQRSARDFSSSDCVSISMNPVSRLLYWQKMRANRDQGRPWNRRWMSSYASRFCGLRTIKSRIVSTGEEAKPPRTIRRFSQHFAVSASAQTYTLTRNSSLRRLGSVKGGHGKDCSATICVGQSSNDGRIR